MTHLALTMRGALIYETNREREGKSQGKGAAVRAKLQAPTV